MGYDCLNFDYFWAVESFSRKPATFLNTIPIPKNRSGVQVRKKEKKKAKAKVLYDVYL